MKRTILSLASLAIGSLCYSDEVGPTLSVYVVEASASTGSRFVDTTEHPKLGYIPRDPAIRITTLWQAMAKPVPWKKSDGHNNVLASGTSYRVQFALNMRDTKALYKLWRTSNSKVVASLSGDRILGIISPPHYNGDETTFEINAENEQEMLEIVKELKPLCAAADLSPEQSAEKRLHEILGTKSIVRDTPFGGRLTMIDVPNEWRGEIRQKQVKLFDTLRSCGTRESVRVLAAFLEDNRYIYEPGDDYGSPTIAEDAGRSLDNILRHHPEFPGATSARGDLQWWWKANKAAYESSPPTAPTPK